MYTYLLCIRTTYFSIELPCVFKAIFENLPFLLTRTRKGTIGTERRESRESNEAGGGELFFQTCSLGTRKSLRLALHGWCKLHLILCNTTHLSEAASGNLSFWRFSGESRHPRLWYLLWWGPALCQLYAYLPVPGGSHCRAGSLRQCSVSSWGGHAKRFWEEAGDSEPAGRTPARGPGRLASAPRLSFPHWGPAGLCHCRPRSWVCTASSAGACGVSPGVSPQRTALPAWGHGPPPARPCCGSLMSCVTSSGGRVRASVSTVNGNFTYFPPSEGKKWSETQ